MPKTKMVVNPQQFYVLGFQYGDVMTCSSDGVSPIIFNSLEEAEEDIAEFKADILAAGMDCDLDWMPVIIEDYSISELISLCGLESQKWPLLN